MTVEPFRCALSPLNRFAVSVSALSVSLRVAGSVLKALQPLCGLCKCRRFGGGGLEEDIANIFRLKLEGVVCQIHFLFLFQYRCRTSSVNACSLKL